MRRNPNFAMLIACLITKHLKWWIMARTFTKVWWVIEPKTPSTPNLQLSLPTVRETHPRKCQNPARIRILNLDTSATREQAMRNRPRASSITRTATGNQSNHFKLKRCQSSTIDKQAKIKINNKKIALRIPLTNWANAFTMRFLKQTKVWNKAVGLCPCKKPK